MHCNCNVCGRLKVLMKDPPSTCLGGIVPGNNLVINRHEELPGHGKRGT